MTNLVPVNEHLLVELGESYQHIKVATKVYEAKSNGIVRRVDLDILEDFDFLIGKRVFWQEDRAGAPIERNGIQYALINVDDIQGYEEVGQ